MTNVVNNEEVSTISKTDSITTLINVFAVEPENQQRLVELLIEATEELMSKIPGFISANVHKSLDGTQVVNYAQWQDGSVKSIDEILEKAKELGGELFVNLSRKLAEITKFKPLFYKVCYINKAC